MGPSAGHITPQALAARIRSLPSAVSVTADLQIRVLQLPAGTSHDGTWAVAARLYRFEAMLSINRQLGFRASAQVKTWQVSTDRARAYLSG